MLFDTDVLIWALRGNSKAAIPREKTKEKTIELFPF
jgi:hypothetical protein